MIGAELVQSGMLIFRMKELRGGISPKRGPAPTNLQKKSQKVSRPRVSETAWGDVCVHLSQSQ